MSHSLNQSWRPLEDEQVEEIKINEEPNQRNKSAMKTFRTKLPLIIQAVVFGFAYWDWAPRLLRFLNNLFFKSGVKFSWSLYNVATRR